MKGLNRERETREALARVCVSESELMLYLSVSPSLKAINLFREIKITFF